MRARDLIPSLLVLTLAAPFPADARDAAASPLVGRWDITVRDPAGYYPSWLEITEKNETLSARFVGRVGGARTVDRIMSADRSVAFQISPQFENRPGDLVFDGRLHGAWMAGMTTNDRGIPVRWTAVRAPELAPRTPVRWGKPISLFSGPTLDGWRPRHGEGIPLCWSVANGVLASEVPCVDLVTRRKFRDFQLHLECRVGKNADSGIHLRGRYEVQIRDDAAPNDEPRDGEMGSVYGMIAPARKAAKPAGEWQSFDITLIGRRVTVVLNGQTVIDDAEIPGITGDALDSDEGKPGPIVLQGYLGDVSFRNIVLTPAE